MEFTLTDECWIRFCYVGKYTDIPQQDLQNTDEDLGLLGRDYVSLSE